MFDYVKKSFQRLHRPNKAQLSKAKIHSTVNGETIVTDFKPTFLGIVEDFSINSLKDANVPIENVNFQTSVSMDDMVDVDNSIDRFLDSQKKSISE